MLRRGGQRRQRRGLAPADRAPDAVTAGLAGVAKRLLEEADTRQEYFPRLVLHAPAWPILLDLYIHTAEDRRVCVSDACVAARVPSTTALRHIDKLVEHGAVQRIPDPMDHRRTHLKLTAPTFTRMSQYLAGIAGIDALVADTPSQSIASFSADHGQIRRSRS